MYIIANTHNTSLFLSQGRPGRSKTSRSSCHTCSWNLWWHGNLFDFQSPCIHYRDPEHSSCLENRKSIPMLSRRYASVLARLSDPFIGRYHTTPLETKLKRARYIQKERQSSWESSRKSARPFIVELLQHMRTRDIGEFACLAD